MPFGGTDKNNISALFLKTEKGTAGGERDLVHEWVDMVREARLGRYEGREKKQGRWMYSSKFGI